MRSPSRALESEGLKRQFLFGWEQGELWKYLAAQVKKSLSKIIVDAYL